MRIALLTMIAVCLLRPGVAQAQYYERHWNTAVVVAPVPARRITTGALQPAAGLKLSKLIGPLHHALEGIASYYWQGQKTASGERFDPHGLTAAHRTLPMNTRVKVTHVETGRSVVVRINDRGPFKPGRVVDLSDRAADILGMKSRGLAHVKLEVLH